MTNLATTTDANGQAQPVMALTDFIADFGPGLLEAVQRENPPLYQEANPARDIILDGLKRQPFEAQRRTIQATVALLQDAGERAAIINAEMGTGKTLMAIAAATVLHREGSPRTLCIVPPHLVYKWRREILDTVPDAKVWILNGPDSLARLLQIRDLIGVEPKGPEFFVLGRVRMRMGFHWKPAYQVRTFRHRVQIERGNGKVTSAIQSTDFAACPDCNEVVTAQTKEGETYQVRPGVFPTDKRLSCKACGSPLWTLKRKGQERDEKERAQKALMQIPTIGPKTAEKLVRALGTEMITKMLADNVYEFVNLMDENGDFVFTDRQAQRMERALSKLEFGFGQGDYQLSEWIKRYLPNGFFGCCLVDEGHEYKAANSAQAEAMGVIVGKVQKAILLTGTLMGGYADDIFFLLWRLLPQRMMEDGYRYNGRGSLGSAAQAFMRQHGVLKEIVREDSTVDYRTSRGRKRSVRTVKGPGFGPKAIARYILPFTVFLKLKDLGTGILPPYEEVPHQAIMTPDQAEAYRSLASTLKEELKRAIVTGDFSLLGVVLNCLLRWPDSCFRPEVVNHPRSGQLITFKPSIFEDGELAPKEMDLINLCLEQKKVGRRVLVYTTYTGRRDLAGRYKTFLQEEGIKPAVLRSSVSPDKREDWIADQVDKGVDAIICNPELVKTGLDLYDFPELAFMQTGFNVYTLQQAARRSWRIGQTEPVNVNFFGYEDTAQIECFQLMAQKIAVAQSTSGEMPDTGLDLWNQDGESIEVALARQLVSDDRPLAA